MLPTLRQLEYVLALAETGHFGEAASRCGVSQPALSRQIRDVEELLGVALFERSRPRTLITPAGKGVVARARLVLAQARDLVDEAARHTGGHRGTLRLGVIPTIAPYGLPGMLARLRQSEPRSRIEVREVQTAPLLDALRAGDLDAGLLAHPFDADGLDGEDIAREPFVLLIPADHPLACTGPVAIEALAGARLILLEDGHCLRDQAAEVCALAGAPPDATVAAASLSTLARLVEGGFGVTLLPASALASELRPGHGLVARPFAAPPPGRVLSLRWRATSPHGAWFAVLATTLRAHYAALNESIPAILGPTPRIVTLTPSAPRAAACSDGRP